MLRIDIVCPNQRIIKAVRIFSNKRLINFKAVVVGRYVRCVSGKRGYGNWINLERFDNEAFERSGDPGRSRAVIPKVYTGSKVSGSEILGQRIDHKDISNPSQQVFPISGERQFGNHDKWTLSVF